MFCRDSQPEAFSTSLSASGPLSNEVMATNFPTTACGQARNKSPIPWSRVQSQSYASCVPIALIGSRWLILRTAAWCCHVSSPCNWSTNKSIADASTDAEMCADCVQPISSGSDPMFAWIIACPALSLQKKRTRTIAALSPSLNGPNVSSRSSEGSRGNPLSFVAESERLPLGRRMSAEPPKIPFHAEKRTLKTFAPPHTTCNRNSGSISWPCPHTWFQRISGDSLAGVGAKIGSLNVLRPLHWTLRIF